MVPWFASTGKRPDSRDTSQKIGNPGSTGLLACKLYSKYFDIPDFGDSRFFVECHIQARLPFVN